MVAWVIIMTAPHILGTWGIRFLLSGQDFFHWGFKLLDATSNGDILFDVRCCTFRSNSEIEIEIGGENT